MKYYYGFRYYGNRDTTTGEPNKITGKLSIAGVLVAFDSQDQLQEWLDKEDLYKESGLGGGIREQVTKQEVRYLLKGFSKEHFEEIIEDLQNSIEN